MKPTILLVHGAWADSSSWNGVVDLLLKDGYDVRALPNTLRGLEADAAVISNYLKTVSGPVVLVGHSYGGSVISVASANAPNVKALVYVDAFAPEAGESIQEELASAPPPPADFTIAVPFTTPTGGLRSERLLRRRDLGALFGRNAALRRSRIVGRRRARDRISRRPWFEVCLGTAWPAGTWLRIPARRFSKRRLSLPGSPSGNPRGLIHNDAATIGVIGQPVAGSTTPGTVTIVRFSFDSVFGSPVTTDEASASSARRHFARSLSKWEKLPV